MHRSLIASYQCSTKDSAEEQNLLIASQWEKLGVEFSKTLERQANAAGEEFRHRPVSEMSAKFIADLSSNISHRQIDLTPVIDSIDAVVSTSIINLSDALNKTEVQVTSSL